MTISANSDMHDADEFDIGANVPTADEVPMTADESLAAASDAAAQDDFDVQDNIIRNLDLSSKTDAQIRETLRDLRNQHRDSELLLCEAAEAANKAMDAMYATPEGRIFLALKEVRDNRKAEYDACTPAIKAYSKEMRERMKAFKAECVVKIPRRSKKSREKVTATIPMDQAVIIGLQ
jgi:hypothetical protein